MEAAIVRAQLLAIAPPKPALPKPARKLLRNQEWVRPRADEPIIGTPLGLTPTSPVLEKQEPKVHGVNAQRETRSRPKVGGARGKHGP